VRRTETHEAIGRGTLVAIPARHRQTSPRSELREPNGKPL